MSSTDDHDVQGVSARSAAAGRHDEAPVTTGRHDEAPVAAPASAIPDPAQHRRDVVNRERDRFGGMRFFLAFFGWLTATGMVVLLSAIATGIGALLGAGRTGASKSSMLSTGLTGAIVLGVILLVAYYCGGYVAARMARFNGIKQGVAVWLWAIIIAILAGIAGVVASGDKDLTSQLSSVPTLPFTSSAMTAAGIGAAVAAIVLTLIGAILGGLAGMRFHRKVDRFGLENE